MKGIPNTEKNKLFNDQETRKNIAYWGNEIHPNGWSSKDEGRRQGNKARS